jgi:hypothetical protein
MFIHVQVHRLELRRQAREYENQVDIKLVQLRLVVSLSHPASLPELLDNVYCSKHGPSSRPDDVYVGVF